MNLIFTHLGFFVLACWIDPVELSQVYIKSSKQSPQLKIENFPASIIPLRSRDPYNWIPYVASGGAIWPISVLSRESDSVIFLKDPWNEGSGSGSGKPASNPLHVYQSPVPAPQRNTNHDTAVNRKISVFQENESKVSSLSSIEEPHIENPQDIPITQRSYSLDDKIGDDNNKVEDEEVGAPIEQNKV